MNKIVLLSLSLLFSPFFAFQAQAGTIGACTDAQLLAYSPQPESIASHRQFQVPVIDYAYATKKDDWGYSLLLRIDESGRVICYGAKDSYGRNEALDGPRRAQLAQLASWRYAPFLRDKTPVAAIISEQIDEQELPERHVPLPEVPLKDVHIALRRTACFGTCPAYSVDIFGDGSVVYKGDNFVDIEGEHRYPIPQQDVAELVESLRKKNLWSLRADYQAQVTDNPTYILTISLGGQTHSLKDYLGSMVGMPRAVSDFEREVDSVARSEAWINLEPFAVDRLKDEGFKFDSPDGAGILARAALNSRGSDDRAMLDLIKLGAPLVDGEDYEPGFHDSHRTLIENALINHHEALVTALIKKGALKTQGKPDQQKIDAAFRAAIQGGRLASAKEIWNVRGAKLHPSLSFDDDDSASHRHSSKKSSIILLLNSAHNADQAWQGLAISKWLVEKGCSLKAIALDGTTLLHIAASADDAPFVRYLLDHGLNPSAPGRYGLPALGSTSNEEVALMLLEAGSNPSDLDTAGRSFRVYAIERHWAGVVAWLDAHPKG